MRDPRQDPLRGDLFSEGWRLLRIARSFNDKVIYQFAFGPTWDWSDEVENSLEWFSGYMQRNCERWLVAYQVYEADRETR